MNQKNKTNGKRENMHNKSITGNFNRKMYTIK